MTTTGSSTYAGQVRWQLREDAGGGGFSTQNDLLAHFGLGNARKVDTLRIEWPSGIVQELTNVATNQFLTVTEPSRLAAQGPGQLQVRCWKGMSYEVQVSSGFVDWTPVGTITNLDGTLKFVDPDASSQPQRFYRALTK